MHEMVFSRTMVTVFRDIVREAVFQQANVARNASAPMTMKVKDAKGEIVETAYVGAYIQIEMQMTSSENNFVVHKMMYDMTIAI